jgi:hydroxymethylpyrimidine pyrophosphatase-like HAD family hydrolase
MKPLHSMSVDEAARLRGLLFDLDDTFLDHGRLTLPAFDALSRLSSAGLRLGVVTGRPAGFGQVLVRQWPIDFAVTENGGVAFVNEQGRARCSDRHGPAERQRQRERLAEVAGEIGRRFDLWPSEDNIWRLGDYSLDIGEFVRPPPQSVRDAERFARALGVHTLRSSIHLHLSYSGEDKASGTVRILHEAFGEDPSASLGRYAFIGDSENDAACFAAFHTTIGVANLSGRPSIGPRYITEHSRAEGFREAADTLLGLR